jgi:type IV secretion system protein VirD4
MNKVHFILDEAAALGRMDCVEDAIDKYRGYGVRLQFYYQSPGQLKKCFPEDQGQTLLSNSMQVFFGVNDNQTAEYVSAHVGEGTIIVTSGGRSSGSSGHSSSSQQGAQYGTGASSNSSSNWQQQARKLLKPEEVMALDPKIAISLAPGMPPILTRLARYYEEPKLGRRPGWIKRSFTACCILAASFVFLIAATGAAAVLVLEVNEAVKASRGTYVFPWTESSELNPW